MHGLGLFQCNLFGAVLIIKEMVRMMNVEQKGKGKVEGGKVVPHLLQDGNSLRCLRDGTSAVVNDERDLWHLSSRIFRSVSTMYDLNKTSIILQ